MIFGALQAAALEGVENIINVALSHDPASAQGLASMAGKIMLIDSSMPAMRVAVEPTANGILLHHNWQDEADITISGSLVSIAGMAINSGDMVSFSGTGVNVTGNLEMLRQLNHIMAGLDIDWEAALAELVGDIPAHLLAESIRNSANFRANAADRAKSALVEVSQEELQLTPSKNEYDDFVQSARHLKNEYDDFVQSARHLATDVDRLAARANKLRLLIQDRNAIL